MPRPTVVQSSDEDDEYQPSQSQAGHISSEEVKKLAGHVCNFLLVMECKKIPAKRMDIKRMVLKDRARHFNAVMTKATNMMESVFGYKIKELQSCTYILINSLGASAGERGISTELQAARTGLLTSILAAIFMTGDKMQEGALSEYLHTLGLDMKSKELHPLLGNVHKLVHQDLVREKYLDITQDTSTDPPTREYQWGERAHLELSKKDILELVCKVYGENMRPEVWTSQWKEVQRETNAQQQAS